MTDDDSADRNDLQRALTAMLKIHDQEWRAHLPPDIDDVDFVMVPSQIKSMMSATSRHIITEVQFSDDMVVLTMVDFKRHLREAYYAGKRDAAETNLDRRFRQLERRYEEEKAAQAAGRRLDAS